MQDSEFCNHLSDNKINGGVRMLRMVLDDFRRNFMHGVKRTFARFESGYLFFWALIFPPIFFHISMQGFFIYYFSFIPMLGALLLSRIYGGWVEKTLFLCPLGKEDREKYYLISWGIRTAAPVILFLLLDGILFIAGWLHPLAFLFMFILMAFYSAAVNMYCGGTRGENRMSEQKYILPKNYEAWNVIGQILGLGAMLVLIAVVVDEEEPIVTIWEFIIISVFLFANILIQIKIIKYFRFIINYVTEFEQSVEYEPKKHGGQEI